MDITEAQAGQHNALTKEGWELLKPEMIIHGGPIRHAPGFFARRKLRRAIVLFGRAIELNPRGWSSMWATGKALQRLGDHSGALRWFMKAHDENPSQVDVVREAGLTALDCGAIDQAVRLCFAAVRLSPDDLGLQANLSLAYLMAGDYERAAECAKVAVAGA